MRRSPKTKAEKKRKAEGPPITVRRGGGPQDVGRDDQEAHSINARESRDLDQRETGRQGVARQAPWETGKGPTPHPLETHPERREQEPPGTPVALEEEGAEVGEESRIKRKVGHQQGENRDAGKRPELAVLAEKCVKPVEEDAEEARAP